MLSAQNIGPPVWTGQPCPLVSATSMSDARSATPSCRTFAASFTTGYNRRPMIS